MDNLEGFAAKKREIEYAFSLMDDDDLIDIGITEVALEWEPYIDHVDTNILRELILKECVIHLLERYRAMTDQIYEVSQQ
jgi:hypothetical protein